MLSLRTCQRVVASQRNTAASRRRGNASSSMSFVTCILSFLRGTQPSAYRLLLRSTHTRTIVLKFTNFISRFLILYGQSNLVAIIEICMCNITRSSKSSRIFNFPPETRVFKRHHRYFDQPYKKGIFIRSNLNLILN